MIGTDSAKEFMLLARLDDDDGGGDDDNDDWIYSFVLENIENFSCIFINLMISFLF